MGEYMRIFLSVAAALAAFSAMAKAAPVTSFAGLEVSIGVTVTDDGDCDSSCANPLYAGSSFDAYLIGANTATVGDGHEFHIGLAYYDSPATGGAVGFLDLYIDILPDGTIIAAARVSFTAVSFYLE